MLLRYLAGYPPALLAQARSLIAEGRLAESVTRRYPEGHEMKTDRALYDYVGALKARHMRNAPALALYERFGFRRLDRGAATSGYVELTLDP